MAMLDHMDEVARHITKWNVLRPRNYDASGTGRDNMGET